MKAVRFDTPGPDELGKAQSVRLYDVFLLGPFMIWAATQSKPLPRWAKATLFVSGVATIIYNLNNYGRVEAVLQEQIRQQARSPRWARQRMDATLMIGR